MAVQTAQRPATKAMGEQIAARKERRARRGAGRLAMGLALLYLALQEADVWTTMLGRTVGMPEGNPLAALIIAQHGWTTMILLKFVGAAAYVAAALLITRLDRRIGVLLLIALVLQMAVLVALNVAALQPTLPALPTWTH